MSDENNLTGSEAQRRHFLKAASGVGAVGPFLSTSVVAGESPVNSIRVVEVGVEASLPPVNEPDTRYKIRHWESPPRYLVDRSEQQLAVYAGASDTERRQLLQGNAAVNAKTVGAPPAAIFAQPTETLQSNTGANLNGNYLIHLDGEHRFPGVTVRPNSQSTGIEGEGVEATVESETIRRIDIPEQTVSVRTVTRGDRIENPDVPEHLRGYERIESSRTVTVTPELVVRDRGQLDVYDRTDQSV